MITIKQLLLPCALTLTLTWIAIAQDRSKRTSPQPNARMPKAELLKLTGDPDGARLSRDINLLWLTGPEDHGGGEHDYIRIKELFVPMLDAIPRITVEEAFQFPSQEQFDRADVMIQYLHLPDLSDEQFAMLKGFVEGGGGIVSIHESCIMRPVGRAKKLAECIGCSWKGNSASRWSKFGHGHQLFLDTEHPAFKGLPKSVLLNDESYWNLLAEEEVRVIGALHPAEDGTPRSFAEVLASKQSRSQAFWTYTPGKVRVFGTTTGHYTYTYYDPIYRLLLMRGLAWVLDEDPLPLMPVVFEGITGEDGLVGTTEKMMDYKNRKR